MINKKKARAREKNDIGEKNIKIMRGKSGSVRTPAPNKINLSFKKYQHKRFLFKYIYVKVVTLVNYFAVNPVKLRFYTWSVLCLMNISIWMNMMDG